MNYVIMRKNDPITAAEFSGDGTMLRYSQNFINPELAPLQSRSSSSWLRDWWRTRSIPIGQGKIKAMLALKGLLTIETQSFASNELKLLSYITDRSLVDAEKLPDPEYIRSLYAKDSQADQNRTDRIAAGYAKKVELFRAFQNGEDLRKRLF